MYRQAPFVHGLPPRSSATVLNPLLMMLLSMFPGGPRSDVLGPAIRHNRFGAP